MIGDIAVSGVGRIGRLSIRKAFSQGSEGVRLRAINASHPASTVAHLLKYDTIHGKWDADIRVEEQALVINGNRVQLVAERDPLQLDWEKLGVETVIDATGKFTSRNEAAKHLAAGAKKVIITAPGADMDHTVVMGVNERLYNPARHHIVSTASCTTNCVAPLLHIADRAFGIVKGWVTTVHAFTNDQNHLDNPHKDLRRARSCTRSIIPTTTGIGKALKSVLPHLAEHVQGLSLRVPTEDVSLVDMTVQLKSRVSKAEVKAAFATAIESGPLSSVVAWSDEPLVSSDYVGSSHSAVVDGLSTMISGNELKLLAWYDNEWAYACRVIDMAVYMAQSNEGEGADPEWVKMTVESC